MSWTGRTATRATSLDFDEVVPSSLPCAIVRAQRLASSQMATVAMLRTPPESRRLLVSDHWPAHPSIVVHHPGRELFLRHQLLRRVPVGPLPIQQAGSQHRDHLSLQLFQREIPSGESTARGEHPGKVTWHPAEHHRVSSRPLRGGP